jgi:hypothetical protein
MPAVSLLSYGLSYVRQTYLCCPCGRPPVKRGLCATCYALRRRDLEYFAGLRERVIERDGHLCRGCGGRPRRLGVHHRRPGVSSLRWMIALCPACHQRVHRTRVWRRQLPDPVRALWRELHPKAAEQLGLPFDAPAPLAEIAWPLLWVA